MTLEVAALTQLVRIIDRIYEGKPPPRVDGKFGQFLRQCHRGRFDVQQLLGRGGIATTNAGWVNGLDIGPVTLSPLAGLRGFVPNDLWGPVEHLPALCEELGAAVDLTLWTSATAANRAHVLLSGELTPITLSGGFRWFAPTRITPGDATVEADSSSVVNWRNARFLKATADDAARSPHPLEYVLDYRIGPPGLKVFRVIPVHVRQGEMMVLPGLEASAARAMQFAEASTPTLWKLRDGDLALIFAFLEPWSNELVAVDVERTDVAGCFSHAVAWADFQAELQEKPQLTRGDLEMVRSTLAVSGLDPPPAQDALADLPQRMLRPPARGLLRWLRYRDRVGGVRS